MVTPTGHPYGYPIGHPFLGSTSLNYCPFGAGMLKCVPINGANIFRSVPLRDVLYLRAPSDPLMGTLSGTHVGTLRVPTLKNNLV